MIITYYWPPSGGAGVQRSLKFVKYLTAFGIEPIVITVDPSQATYPILDESLLKEVSADVKVIRTRSFEPLKVLAAVKGKDNIPHGGFANTNKESITQKTLRFIRGNFFIPDARKGWVRFAVTAASDLIEKEKIDTVFVSSPPHSSQLIGLELKEKYNVRWIADMRDPWTDIYYYEDLLHTALSAKIDANYEKKVLESADAVISVSEPINTMFLAKSDKLDPKKFHVIPNGYDESDFDPNIKKDQSFFQITYVGTMADNYRPSILFRSIKKLMDEFNGSEKLVRLTMVGSSAAAINRLMQETALEKEAELISHVDHSTAINYMQKANVLLLVIPDVKDSDGILTGKLFEYLACKVPVIGLGPVNGKANKILAECKSGRLFERTEESALYENLKQLYLDWKAGKSSTANTEEIKKYSRRELSRTLAEILK